MARFLTKLSGKVLDQPDDKVPNQVAKVLYHIDDKVLNQVDDKVLNQVNGKFLIPAHKAKNRFTKHKI